MAAKRRCALDQSHGLFSGVDKVGVLSSLATMSTPICYRILTSSPGLGYRPIPSIPFSDSKTISVPSGRKAGAASGMPMPRLTYMPSFNSCAARLIMRSRFCDDSVEPSTLLATLSHVIIRKDLPPSRSAFFCSSGLFQKTFRSISLPTVLLITLFTYMPWR